MKKFVVSVFILLSTLLCSANFVFNQNCSSAYQLIFDLKFEQAEKLLEEEKKINPSNPVPVYLNHYILFLKAFISEEEKDFIALKNHRDDALALFDNSDKDSPYYLYCHAEVNLLTAFVKIKFKEYVTGALEIRRAFKDLEENQRLYPAFKPNLKGLGILHGFIGAVPENYKWLLKLAGMNGTIKQGLDEMQSFYEITKSVQGEYHYLHKEASIIYLFSKQHLEKNNEQVLRLKGQLPAPTGTLEIFTMCNILYNSAKNDELLETLNLLKENDDVYKMHYLHFLKGLALLNKLDNKASDEFKTYIQNFKGTSFIKASYQKLGWLALMKSDTLSYRQYMNKCRQAKGDFNDEDKQAQKEAEEGILPNIMLLKARLLFDGGYYVQALSQLAGKQVENFPSLRDKLELTYRLGRIYDKTGKKEKAIELYDKTITNGKSFGFYFAANSSLNAGLLYENSNDKVNAEKYYELCLTMRNHEYQNSIDQKARAGLNRLGKNTTND